MRCHELLNIPSEYSHILRKVKRWRDDYNGKDRQELQPIHDFADADLVSSEVMYAPGYHTLMLDIDYHCAVIPSSTEGHHHLYLDKLLEWSAVQEILEVLAKHGVIEHEYADMSIRDKATFLRVPWRKKGSKVA